MVSVEPTFAVEAIKRAYLAIGWHKVYAKAKSKTTTMYRSVNRTRINNSAHAITNLVYAKIVK